MFKRSRGVSVESLKPLKNNSDENCILYYLFGVFNILWWHFLMEDI